jgi:hypothetical protein
MKQGTVEQSLKRHVDQRVEEQYPDEEYGGKEGHVPPEILAMAKEQQQPEKNDKSSETAFDMKQSTMHDAPNDEEHLFRNVRPSIVTDEASSADTFNDEMLAEHALKSITTLTIEMSNKFENQFVSHYLPRIFPWALNYECGGPEYPKLFSDWDDILQGEHQLRAANIGERWRRIADEAPLLDGEYAAMLATRAESQIAGDWMAVPAARNLHWRYAVLHSAFITCTQKVAPGEALSQNLENLIEATKTIWERIASNTVYISGEKRLINGNIAMLFSADGITTAERNLCNRS